MKVAIALCAVVATAAALPEIVGGVETAKGKHSYVVGLRTSADDRNKCGGSLIAPNVVLTAAHCTDNGLDYVSIGSHYLSGTSDGEQIKVKENIIHTKYNSTTESYDFAILILERDSKFSPVEVSFDNVVAGTPTIVRGWGYTRFHGEQSNVLLEVGVDTISDELCTKWLSRNVVDESMVCAGGEGGADACKGDSGGPMTVEINGTEKLVGLSSWGIKCARKELPGVYGRISMARDFIEPHLMHSPATSPKLTGRRVSKESHLKHSPEMSPKFC
ncbi:hypothetical protein DYB32_004391 [Aphanomyces invadans]|uniref:Peptidase S1 domain-containing protein n=1 Tax=Aphanomyces invadans TaxID=157072 RepID=A0A3R6Z4X4_9STRA|nr:hypothetical protein DYB32_004391 [Aphanomyces invadans]